MKINSQPLTFLTATRRLAVAQRQTQSQLPAEKQLQVYAFQDWLKSVSCQIACLPGCEPIGWLSQSAERRWWQAIMMQTSEEWAVHADNVMQAFALLKQWDIPLSDLASVAAGKEQHYFIGWARDFVQKCQEEGYWPEAERIGWVCDNLQKVSSQLASEYQVLGYDDIPPAQKRLFRCLETLGSKVQIASPASSEAKVYRCGCKTQAEELHQAAIWAKQYLSEKPQANIGIVVPQLSSLRALVLRTFRQVFSPDSFVQMGQKPEYPFSISGGIGLGSVPVIRDTYDVLRILQTKETEATVWLRLFKSPYFQDGFSQGALRSKCVEALMALKISRFTPQQMLLWGRQQGMPEALLNFCAEIVRAHFPKEKKNLIDWSRWCEAYWKKLGWPGERVVDSGEYQAIEQLVAIMASLEGWPGVEAYGFSEFLQILKAKLDETLYQMKSPQANVQVLGLLEAGGLSFDALWVTGFDQNQWPPSARPNPFLPVILQQNHQMPHASQARELDFAQKIMEGYARHAKTLIYSWASQEGEVVTLASALIKDFPMLEHIEIPKSSIALASESIEESPVPFEALEVSGGSGVIRDQAQCPFKAFAKHRLHANIAQPEAPMFLGAAERGILLHQLLADVWLWIKTQAELRALDDADIIRFLKAQGDRLFSKNPQLKALPSAYQQQEINRLVQQIIRWLALERARPEPFEVVEVETSKTITLAGKQYQIRLDRIDKLLGKEPTYLLIDYKTGRVAKDWFAERPSCAQLVLYSQVAMPVSGIAYAQLSPEASGFIGIADEGLSLDGVDNIETWADLTASWDERLKALSEAFSKGVFFPDPKNDSACQQCDLQSLCRIEELANG